MCIRIYIYIYIYINTITCIRTGIGIDVCTCIGAVRALWGGLPECLNPAQTGGALRRAKMGNFLKGPCFKIAPKRTPGVFRNFPRPQPPRMHKYCPESPWATSPSWRLRRGVSVVACPSWRVRRGVSVVACLSWRVRRGVSVVACVLVCGYVCICA